MQHACDYTHACSNTSPGLSSTRTVEGLTAFRTPGDSACCHVQTRINILQEANEGLMAAAAAAKGRKGPNGTPPVKGALRR